MNISGVLVFAKPELLQSVSEVLVEIPGVEVHAATPQGKMVVTIECEDMKDTVDRVTQLQYVQGVLSVSMIYNHFDDTDDEFAVDLNNCSEVPVCSCAEQ